MEGWFSVYDFFGVAEAFSCIFQLESRGGGAALNQQKCQLLILGA
tara:strand:- start:348 stop:482 length:135 start_codon:yes stop_codon:yes gene_type:complete